MLRDQIRTTEGPEASGYRGVEVEVSDAKVGEPNLGVCRTKASLHTVEHESFDHPSIQGVT